MNMLVATKTSSMKNVCILMKLSTRVSQSNPYHWIRRSAAVAPSISLNQLYTPGIIVT